MIPISVSRPVLRGGLQRMVAASAVSRGPVERHNSTRMYSSTMHDNDPEILEREKHRNLTGKTSSNLFPHAPGWNEKLASASEATVKADKSTDSPLEMQKRTVDDIKLNLDPDHRQGSTDALYTLDEVTGPLKTARGLETTDEVIVNAGKVVRNTQRKNFVEIEIEEDSRMTPSEEDVKADRGELV
ncbi:hypothetical protein FA15DRAFT_666347 [Coprinopsis marcescibilis]|uniref:Uncharacterized protein n=1 Tax=Coprinopsis marcescibilis TaxID=230819 RepID=A0A5C3L490_COPMA|nr:hypothetical protein FA15DRAFT_666347 [Coprinopsis marcescibilis]